jgi:alpha-L-fucosidase
MFLMDFANDDNFSSRWISSPEVREPWWSVTLNPHTTLGSVVITESKAGVLKEFVVEKARGERWETIPEVAESVCGRVHILRFPSVEADGIRVRFLRWEGELSIAEIGAYAPER